MTPHQEQLPECAERFKLLEEVRIDTRSVAESFGAFRLQLTAELGNLAHGQDALRGQVAGLVGQREKGRDWVSQLLLALAVMAAGGIGAVIGPAILIALRGGTP